MFNIPIIAYIFAGLGLAILLTLIPNRNQKIKKSIGKYIGKKEARTVLLTKFEKSFLIKAITPKKGSIKYERETNQLRKAGIKIGLEKLSVIKVGVAVILFFIFLAVQLNLNTLREQGVLSLVNSEGNAATLLFGDNAENHASNNALYDSLFIEVVKKVPNYKKYFKKDNIKDLATQIAIVRDEMEIEDPNDEYVRKIMATLLEAYSISIITPTKLAIIIFLALFCTGIVDLLIVFKRNMRSRRIEKEFEKIEAVTILLLHRKNINIISLLQQMKQQSRLLKPYIQQCLNRYTSDPYKALDELIEEVNNIEFTKFINILKQCLDSDKDTNTQILRIQRKLRLALQETVNKQRNKNKRLRLTLLQFPLMLLLILLIILPFLDIIKNTI